MINTPYQSQISFRVFSCYSWQISVTVFLPMRPVLCLLATLLLTACQPGEQDTRTLRLAHALSPEHPVHRAMVYFGEQIAERSHGRLMLDLYPSGQLGSERECLELVQLGAMDFTKISASTAESFSPDFSVWMLPYVVRDDAHYAAIIQSDVGREILDSARPARFLGLCYYDAGSRSFYTPETPILSPLDLDGLKIRTTQSPGAIAIAKALGASPTPLSYGELYTALQQGVVDGAENNPPSFHTSRHYEICKEYSLDEHLRVPDLLVASTRLWDSLSPEDQTLVREAAQASADYQSELWKEAEAHALETVQAAGVTVHYPDKAPFREKVQPLYEHFREDPRQRALLEAFESL